MHVNCFHIKDSNVNNWDYDNEIDDLLMMIEFVTSHYANKRVAKKIVEGTVVQDKPQLFYRLIRYT